MIQVGMVALRSPKGDFLPSVPLYIRKQDAGIINPNTGNTLAQELGSAEISKLLASKYREYVNGQKEVGNQ